MSIELWNITPKIGYFKNNARGCPSMDETLFSRHLCRKCNYNRLEGHSREENF